MKIAFIGQKGIPTKYGGVERYVEAVSKNLSHLGHKVFVYTRPYYTAKTRKHYQGVNLISLPSINTKYLDAISHVFLATLHALFQDYDVIHYQGVGPSLLSFIPRLLKRRTKIVVTFHSLDRNHAKWSWFGKLVLRLGEWTACKFPHKTITVSKGLQNYCLQKYNTPTTYIPNGVYVKTINSSNKALLDYGLKSQRYFIVVSRFVKHKRIEEVIQAFQSVKNTEMKLLIVGDSSFTDKYTRVIHDLVTKDSRIIFTGWQTGDRLWSLISGAIALVSASEDEGMPITVLEAMSLATPVILSNIEGHRDATVGCLARYFNLGNTRQLTKQLRYARRYQSKLTSEAKVNQKLVRENYDWLSIAQALADVYAQEFVLKRALQNTLF